MIDNDNTIKPMKDCDQIPPSDDQCCTGESSKQQHMKHDKKYSELAKSIGYLRKFDWFDASNPLMKLAPVKLLTPTAYWFMVCCEYFPRAVSIGSDSIKVLAEVLSKIEKQPLTQIIRIQEKKTSSSAAAMEVEDQQRSVDEMTRIVRQAIRKVNSSSGVGTPQYYGKQNAELKQEYTADDEMYIMNMRHELLEMYNKFIGNQSTSNEQMPVQASTPSIESFGSMYSSESTTGEEDSRGSTGNKLPESESGMVLQKQASTSTSNRSSRNDEEILRAMKKQDLDDVIGLLSLELSGQNSENRNQVKLLKQRMSRELESERFIYGGSDEKIDYQEALVDIHKFNSVEMEYLNYLENKQQQMIQASSEECLSAGTNKKNVSNKNVSSAEADASSKAVLEDLACQICNDGDYTDDDLIVFCAKCNVSVHQRCYGIPKIPEGDWICEVCSAFGPNGQHLRCGLCTQRGGALKPSRIPISSNMFQNSNPEYYEYQKKCKQSQASCSSFQKKQKYEESTQEEGLYYDFHTLPKFTHGDEVNLVDEPEANFVWAHVTCALWTPECYFDDKNYYSNVKGIENIEKSRFKLDCSICKQPRSGACVQCARSKCTDAFHPECARRAGVFMEVRNTDQLAYLIYCESHTPLKLRRQLEQKEKKDREEIVKFCRAIDRVRESAVFKDKIGVKKTNSGGVNSVIADVLKQSQQEQQQQQKKLKKKLVMTPKKVQVQLAQNAEQLRKLELEFQKLLAVKMIQFLDSRPVQENTAAAVDTAATGNSENVAAEKTEQKVNKWQTKVFMQKEDPFWSSFVFNGETGIQLYKRYKRIQKDIEKKKEFKMLYFRTLSSLKNIRIVTKEDREKKKKDEKNKIKVTEKQEKLFSIFSQKKPNNSDELQLVQSQLKQKVQQMKKEQKLVDESIKKATEIVKEEIKEEIYIEEPAVAAESDLKCGIIEDEVAVVNQHVEAAAQAEDTMAADNILPHNYEPVNEESEEVYCICRRKYQEGDQMMECEKCNEWYHLECVGFCGTLEQAESIEFACKFCDLKEKNKLIRAARKTAFGHLFLQYDTPHYDAFKNALELRLQLQREAEQAMIAATVAVTAIEVVPAASMTTATTTTNKSNVHKKIVEQIEDDDEGKAEIQDDEAWCPAGYTPKNKTKKSGRKSRQEQDMTTTQSKKKRKHREAEFDGDDDEVADLVSTQKRLRSNHEKTVGVEKEVRRVLLFDDEEEQEFMPLKNTLKEKNKKKSLKTIDDTADDDDKIFMEEEMDLLYESKKEMTISDQVYQEADDEIVMGSGLEQQQVQEVSSIIVEQQQYLKQVDTMVEPTFIENNKTIEIKQTVEVEMLAQPLQSFVNHQKQNDEQQVVDQVKPKQKSIVDFFRRK